ncbi:unnamed protein product [Caenorhabditis sp. 36 PRJEB53466]|nr:unnamed protein product [Caenorhabditis sp. 36 PRJEB53466]
MDMKKMHTHYPLGFRKIDIVVSTTSTHAKRTFRIRTVANVQWEIEMNVTESRDVKKLLVTLSTTSLKLPTETVDLTYEMYLKNKINARDDIKKYGEKQFSKNDVNIQFELDHFDKILEEKNGFSINKQMTFEFFVTVKGTRIVDCVELMDLYTRDPMINDSEVIVNGITLYISKPFLSLQSSELKQRIESENSHEEKVQWDMTKYAFESVYDFLQIAHGVDLCLDGDNFNTIVDLAAYFHAPRITEYCKNNLIKSKEWNVNKKYDISEKHKFWDVIPTLLTNAKTFGRLSENDYITKINEDEDSEQCKEEVTHFKGCFKDFNDDVDKIGTVVESWTEATASGNC